MVQQADSIHTGLEIDAELQQQSVQQKHSSQLTPKQVLSWLPKNATPALLDLISSLFRSAEIDRCILSEDEMADNASPQLRSIRRTHFCKFTIKMI